MIISENDRDLLRSTLDSSSFLFDHPQHLSEITGITKEKVLWMLEYDMEDILKNPFIYEPYRIHYYTTKRHFRLYSDWCWKLSLRLKGIRY